MKRFTPPGAASARRGFTLIELLTVIAIIGVLASLLIVVVSKARQKAMQAKSMSQLRTLGMAIDLYRTENKNFYPFSATSGGGAPYWSETIAPYLPPTKALRITDYRGQTVRATAELICPLVDSDRHNAIGDYGVNGAVLVRKGTSVILNRDGISPISGSALANPSQTVLIMTAEATDQTPPYGNWYVATHQYTNNINATQRPSDRGTGSVLCRFADGHSEAVPLAKMQANAGRYLLPK